MSISISSIRPNASVAYTTNVPQNYSLENQAEVSSTYVNSVKQLQGNTVDPAAPVQYANTRRVSQVSPAEQVEQAQRVGAALNSIADSFGGQNTSYAADMTAASYEMLGQNLDLYA